MSASADVAPARAPLRLPLARLQRVSLWLLVFSGGFVIVEPSPYEILFAFAALVFALAGMRLSPRLAPLIITLVGFNLGGTLSLIPFIDEQPSVAFVAISFYLMFTSMFFAVLMGEDTLNRLAIIRSAFLVAAWGASIAGILGYFDVGGLGDYFTLYNRASGTFKDPNVLGPFLVLPIVYILQDAIFGRMGALKAVFLSSAPLLALFLTFSRGAWGHLLGSVAVLVIITYLTSRRRIERSRVVLLAAASGVLLIGMLAAALSVDSIREVFELRASLDQEYDLGVTGRFGSQLRSIPMLLEEPNGFGPLKYRIHFPEDPHSVYINAFASYGWLGGLSYATLILTTWLVGWRAVFVRSPFQAHAIAIWSTLSVVTIQGIQIDTDHWRHFYLLIGLMWGLAALSAHYTSARPLIGRHRQVAREDAGIAGQSDVSQP